ncbi:NAD synthase family [Synechococcus sp. PCC 7335]|uniref:NAD+ synthase n=1 Tax=Synechococcus sp. (strain ATCC 29403 / PCC 7335) TaxID=91464 RepID=UPI00017ED913|nr:NAD+ synthase [Synechococcus sp. PCC 7335]EDX86706.1 NAD synthase family [Synechococcus sp. PCC 7335]
MKIAIAQINPTVGDLSGNAQRILEAAIQAADLGADLVLTPELSLCGYPPRDLLMRPSFITKTKRQAEALAKALPSDLSVLVGIAEDNPSAAMQGQKPIFNSMALLQSGKVKEVFHKRLLPTYDVFDEDRYFESGTKASSFLLQAERESIHVGVTICEDLWNNETFWGKRTYSINPTQELVENGVDLVVNLSASPYVYAKQVLREDMIAHEAKQHQRAIVYVNQVGGNDDLIFDGQSVAFNRQGELVCRAAAFSTDLKLVNFDIDKQDLQPAVIETTLLAADAEIWSALVLGVKDYARKCGFRKAVIGLSGGIDSALVSAIAAEALGPQNVLGVLMPSPYSSKHSISDAEQLAKNIGIPTETIPIGQLMSGYEKTLDDLFKGTESDVTEENLQSRIRGNLLMAVSNKFGHLLLTTGNKSEMAVGYCTLYGDMNGGLAVIADVPKTRVYSICRWLNRKQALIPNNIITKPPSAELKPGQVDQDSLPDYEILDDILERLVQKQQSADDIVAAGHPAATVEKVVRLVTRSEFKRRQTPPVLKVTDRAFGMGWRMPIASQWSLELSAESDKSK